MPSTQTDRLYGMTTSVAVKPPCRVATTAPITLSGEQTVNSVAVVSGDRVLVKDQASSADNGIYVADTSAWSRASDFDGSLDAVNGTIVLVQNASDPGTLYELQATNPVVIGTSALVFNRSALSPSAFGASLLSAADASAAQTILGFSTFFKTLVGAVSAVALRALLFVAPRAARIDVASVAGVVNLTTAAPDTDDIRMTGALAVTGVTLAEGRVVRVTAGGAFSMVNSANLITQSGANITCAVGDTFSWRGLAGGVVEVMNFVKGEVVVTPPKIINVVEATPVTSYSSAADAGIYDDTIPQLSEGTALMSVSITPTSATSRLRVEFLGDFGVSSGGNHVVVAMYRDSTANAVNAGAVTIALNTNMIPLALAYEAAAGSTSATTFSIRFSGSGTLAYVNGSGVARRLGGAMAATLRVTEIAA